MSKNHFELAAALLSDAADLIGHAPQGTSTIDDHAYGALQLVATHTATDDGHDTLVLWLADRDRILAVVEATAHHGAAHPHTRIIAFRAADLMFAARENYTFAATGRHTYTLAATVGTDTGQLTVDHHPAAPAEVALDDALTLIARTYENAYAAG
jgi:hypothetical protein